jgi:hypothetical protein
MIPVTLMMMSLVGFRDITNEIVKEGVKCEFKARIVEKVTDERGQGLVVEKKPNIARRKGNELGAKNDKIETSNKMMYVLVTGETKIGYTIDGFKEAFMRFEDLEVEMSVMIKGIKVFKKVDDQEIIVVLAKSIEPVE